MNRCTSKIIRSFRRLSAEKKFFIRKFPTVRNWKRYKFSKLKKHFVDTKLPKFTKIGTQRARNSNTANVGILNEKTSIRENFGCPNVSFATPRPPGGNKKSMDLISFFWSSAAAFVGTGGAKTTSLILTVFDFSQCSAEKNLKTKKFESRLQVKCAPQCPRLVAKIFSLLGTVSGEMLDFFQFFLSVERSAETNKNEVKKQFSECLINYLPRRSIWKSIATNSFLEIESAKLLVGINDLHPFKK